eukprot:m51a1_g265 putative domain containing protein (666) ;mRNA; r:235157-237945
MDEKGKCCTVLPAARVPAPARIPGETESLRESRMRSRTPPSRPLAGAKSCGHRPMVSRTLEDLLPSDVVGGVLCCADRPATCAQRQQEGAAAPQDARPCTAVDSTAAAAGAAARAAGSGQEHAAPVCAAQAVSDRAKLMQRRSKIAGEVLSSETSYVGQLCLLCKNYLEPVRKIKGVSADDVLGLFSDVEMLRNLHVKFLDQVMARVKMWGPNSAIGDLFQDASKWIRMYKYYINNYNHALLVLKGLKEKNSAFRKYIFSLDHSDEMGGLSLEGYLVAPVQRIPRYVLLVREMIDSTPDDHADLPLLKDALAKMIDAADYINEKKCLSDNQLCLAQIRKKWKKYKGDLLGNPDRVFVREFVVSQHRGKGKVMFWLFNDIAVVTSSETSWAGKYVFKSQISLQTVSMQRDPEGPKTFRLLSQDSTMTGSCQQEGDVDELFHAIENARSQMIQTAFRRTVTVDPREVSAQFLSFQVTEFRERRLAALRRLIASEKEYIDTLESGLKFFPIIAGLSIPIPAYYVSFFSDFSVFMKQAVPRHSKLLERLRAREAEWATNDTVSDIFAESMAELADYKGFSMHCKEYRQRFDKATECDPTFAGLIGGIEQSSGVALIPLMECVMRRIIEYYVSLQEMVQNTPQKSKDFTAISKAALDVDSLKSSLCTKIR